MTKERTLLVSYEVIRNDGSITQSRFNVPASADLKVLAEQFREHGQLSGIAGCNPAFSDNDRKAKPDVYQVFDFRQ